MKTFYSLNRRCQIVPNMVRYAVSLFLLVNLSAWSKPRPAFPPVPESALNSWRFDQTNWWTSGRHAPSVVDGVSLVESWSGYAVSVQGNGELRFPAVNAANGINLCLDEGSVRFWFSPGWSSGTGPGGWVRLLESGAWSADASAGWWALYVNPTGTEIFFSSQGGGVGRDYFGASLAWSAGEWHQVALTFGAAGTALYLDGELAAQGLAICCLPTVEAYAVSGFEVGPGLFDELTTFAYALSAEEVSLSYSVAAPQAAKGPITPEEEEGWQLLIAQRQFGGELLFSPQGGGVVREKTRQRFSLYSWDGNPSSAPHIQIVDLNGYAVRPEAVDLIQIGAETRVVRCPKQV